MRTIKFLTLTGVLYLLASGCGPIKAYTGPKLPDEQLAIVKRPCFNSSAKGLADSYLDGVEFCAKDIAVLPGPHRLDATREIRGLPYNCYTTEEFDSYGYDSCRDGRESDLRKGNSPRYCDYSSYTRTVNHCTVPFDKYMCQAQVELRANNKYVLNGGEYARDGGQMYLISATGERTPIKCHYDSQFTRVEES